MKTSKSNYSIVSVICALLAMVSVTLAQESTVLDSAQHPQSPSYQAVFPEKIIPLDTRLSWKERFNGDETFNESEVLEMVATTIDPTQEHDHKTNDSSKHHVMRMDGMGTVKQIKTGQGKVKIEHGPIERLGMPAMTMVFKVENVDQLAGLRKDQEVGFSVNNSSGGFVITHITTMPDNATDAVSSSPASAPTGMDATGEIKVMRPNQGKIKIKHGPIDRLGMPAMTMMFKVNNPEMLEGLEKGNTVNFSVDNSSGGFVITNIESAE